MVIKMIPIHRGISCEQGSFIMGIGKQIMVHSMTSDTGHRFWSSMKSRTLSISSPVRVPPRKPEEEVTTSTIRPVLV